jgi:1-acyl-sn-glycerol-3-phosphate acyltransferase
MIRRCLSVTIVTVALPLWALTIPIWVPLTLLADGASRLRRLPTLRLGCYLGVYLAHDLAGTGAAGWLWVRGRFGRRLDLEAHRALQGWWANSLLGWAGRFLGLRVEGIDHRELPDTTFVLLSRHASMADAIIPAAVVAGPMDRFVHYVLKRELRWDPALDIVGTRLGNHFVARGGDTVTESAAIEVLAGRAAPNSVLVIFPEGTYATPQSRHRVLESLRRRGDHESATRAERLAHLLPPKPTGTLAMLRGQPGADVVVLGHAGLEGVARLRGLRQQLPLREPVRLRAWRHRRDDLPDDEDGLVAWLHERWEELDHWVESTRTAIRPGAAPGDPGPLVHGR